MSVYIYIYIYIYIERERERERDRERGASSYDSHTKIHVQKLCTKSYMITDLRDFASDFASDFKSRVPFFSVSINHI